MREDKGQEIPLQGKEHVQTCHREMSEDTDLWRVYARHLRRSTEPKGESGSIWG